MSRRMTSQRSPRRHPLRRFLPLIGQVSGYRRAWLSADILAGLSVAAVALPTAIAYPAIAGLPPQSGINAAILAPIGYALFGPSRQLMMGPDTATTVVLGTVLLSLGVSAPGHEPGQAVALAAMLALSVGLCCIVAGVLGVGFIANFLSRPVLMGFLSGVALDLFIGQLDRLTAVPVQSSGLVRPLVEFASKLDQLNPATLAVGLVLFLLLRILRLYTPRLPGPLLAIALGILLAHVFDLQAHGVRLVGAIPQSLPSFSLPLAGDVDFSELALGTLAILLVSFGSGIVTARSFGSKNHYHVDANRELLGFGAANIAASLFGGFPVTSSDSRTAVNDAMGGRTQLAGLAAAAGLACAVLFLGDLLAYLPDAALGAVIASAAVDLIDLSGFRSLWRLSRIELFIAVLTLLGVVCLGIMTGVAVALAATLAHLLWEASRPHYSLLGSIPGRDGLHKLKHNADANPIPGLVIFLPQSALIFFNAEYVARRLLKNVRGRHDVGWFVLDASAINHIDTTAVAVLEDVRAELAQCGIAFAIADLHSQPYGIIERSGLARRIGADMIFPSAEAAAAAFAGQSSPRNQRPAAS